jgi:hypothetical protein
MRRTTVIIIAVWLVIVCGAGAHFFRAEVDAPEVYARTLDFRLLVFALTRLPFLLLLLIGALAWSRSRRRT